MKVLLFLASHEIKWLNEVHDTQVSGQCFRGGYLDVTPKDVFSVA